MTLSERNGFFVFGIFFCGVFVVFTVLASLLTFPVYPEIEEITRRPAYIYQILSGRFLSINNYAVHFSLSAAVLFSFIGTILIHSFFERTSAPEILYIAFFTVSFSVEAVRLLLPLHFMYSIPPVYMLFSARVLLFARFFGIFSLFAASLCAAGLEVQKTRNVIFIIILADLIITIGVPIDIHTWDTSFNLVNGYNSMFRMIETITFITTILSFLIAARVQDSKEYIFVAIGIMLALLGRNILMGTDNWAGPVPGILMLSAGTWFLCSKLHKIHLWL